MSLLSTDITKVKRLSLKEVKLPAPELRDIEPTPPIKVEKPPTDEEIAYSRLVAINPLLEELVERLDLVSITTGERIRKVELREDIKPHPEPEIKAKEIDKPKLIAFMETLTQTKAIAKYLAEGNTLTSIEALEKFGCFRLGARIYDLKRQGYNIETRIVNKGKKHFAQYRIFYPE